MRGVGLRRGRDCSFAVIVSGWGEEVEVEARGGGEGVDTNGASSGKGLGLKKTLTKKVTLPRHF
jgi:hypothetical protein